MRNTQNKEDGGDECGLSSTTPTAQPTTDSHSRTIPGIDYVEKAYVVPRRAAQGQKDIFVDTSSNEQAIKLAASIKEASSLHNTQRFLRLKDMGMAVWHPELNMAQVIQERGVHFKFVGVFSKAHQSYMLFPHETLLLVEKGAMELYHNNCPLSSQEVRSLCLTTADDARTFSVYCYLRRLGYIVCRRCDALKQMKDMVLASNTTITRKIGKRDKQSHDTHDTSDNKNHEKEGSDTPQPKKSKLETITTTVATTTATSVDGDGDGDSSRFPSSSPFVPSLGLNPSNSPEHPISNSRLLSWSSLQQLVIKLVSPVGRLLSPSFHSPVPLASGVDKLDFPGILAKQKIVSQVRIIPNAYRTTSYQAHLAVNKTLGPSCPNAFSSALYVYKHSSTYKRGECGIPAFVVVPWSCHLAMPTLKEVVAMTRCASPAPVKFAIEQSGTIVFQGLMGLEMPSYSVRRTIKKQKHQEAKTSNKISEPQK